MRRRWRVQATWKVEGEERSYPPRFARTRLGAEQLRRDMERTLSHFPTLVVVVEKVSDATAAAELAGTAADPVHVVHRIEEPSSTTTACGLPSAAVPAVAVDDVFRLSSAQCPECAAPGWTFEFKEVSAGVWRLYAEDERGRTIESEGVEPDAMKQEALRAIADRDEDRP